MPGIPHTLRKSFRSVLTLLVALAMLLAYGVVIDPEPASATSTTVGTQAEYKAALATLSGDSSGAHAITLANDITFTTGGDPVYSGDQDLVIDGAGFTIDADGKGRVLLANVGLGVQVTFKDITLTGGVGENGNGGTYAGGAVYSRDGDVELLRATVTGNQSLAGGSGGGIALSNGTLFVIDSLITDNLSKKGGGVEVTKLWMIGSTVTGNHAGLDSDGGGGIMADEEAIIINSTITGNTYEGDSRGEGGAGLYARGPVTLIYTTIADNDMTSGPSTQADNLRIKGLRGPGNLTSFGSVIGDPEARLNCQIDGTTTSSYSYDDDGTCGFVDLTDTSNGNDPGLLPLGDNGGPTWTMLPDTGSPLLDVIPLSDCHATYTADQRAIERPQGSGCDIGSVEVEAVDYADLELTKSVDADYVKVGDAIPYLYVVENTGTMDLEGVAVVDNQCGPVSYDSGNTGNPNILSPGEIWQYTCDDTAPNAAPSTELTNEATVTAESEVGQVSDTDDYTMQLAVHRKKVVLYYDWSRYVLDPGGADVAFDLNLRKDGSVVGTELFSDNAELRVWLTPGVWAFQEVDLPEGYHYAGYDTWNVGTIPSTRYLDNTRFNYAEFDLSVEKSGPMLVAVGNEITYVYEVKNDGPGAVTPVVTDNKCPTVTYESGDTNGDGYIQSGETWLFECAMTATKADWNAQFPSGKLVNTATVTAAEEPDWAPVFGGDVDSSNDTSRYELYPFALRKDVKIYDDGATAGFADPYTEFTVKATLDGFTDYVTISESDPAYLWLADGEWTFEETYLPEGYYPAEDYFADGFTHKTGQDYPDWTVVNVTWSGCSHGYWKNHTDNWPAGYMPGDKVGDYFAANYYDNATLERALRLGGGGGDRGAEKILLKQAVAALLNEAEYGTAFGPYNSIGDLVTAVDNALAGGRADMIDLAGELDWWNNGICR